MEDRKDNSSRTPRVSPVPTLKPCPFCGSVMKTGGGVNPWGVCPTEGCAGARQVVVLDVPSQVAAWNRRPCNAHDDLVAALRKAAEQFERYIEMHNAKGTTDGAQKAAANSSMAKMCRAALAKAGHAPDTRDEADSSNPRP